jgi:hypothetical protein
MMREGTVWVCENSGAFGKGLVEQRCDLLLAEQSEEWLSAANQYRRILLNFFAFHWVIFKTRLNLR